MDHVRTKAEVWYRYNSYDSIVSLAKQNGSHLFLLGQHFQQPYDAGLVSIQDNFAIQFVLHVVGDYRKYLFFSPLQKYFQINFFFFH